MDIFFQDPAEIPLPPEEVRIREFQAVPWADGRRVKVMLEVDPFQQRPSAQVQILNANDEVVSEVSVVETISRKMEFNMHLRHPEPEGDYRIQVTLYFQPLLDAGEAEEESPQPLPERMVVDKKEAVFSIPE